MAHGGRVEGVWVWGVGGGKDSVGGGNCGWRGVRSTGVGEWGVEGVGEWGVVTVVGR